MLIMKFLTSNLILFNNPIESHILHIRSVISKNI